MLKNDINIPLLATTSLISIMLLIVLLAGVHAWYLYEVQEETNALWGSVGIQHVSDVKTRQLADINRGPRWVNREGNVVGIPIDRAMSIIVEQKGKLPTTRP